MQNLVGEYTVCHTVGDVGAPAPGTGGVADPLETRPSPKRTFCVKRYTSVYGERRKNGRLVSRLRHSRSS